MTSNKSFKCRLSLLADSLTCPVCSRTMRVPSITWFQCPHCDSAFRSNMYASLSSGIAAAGLPMIVGDLMGLNLVTSAFLAILFAFAFWRLLFKVELKAAGQVAV
jgi:hypothetical protein